MLGRTHGLVAFACLTTTVVIFPQSHLTSATIFLSLVANSVGSMTPDIDQASNRLWDLLPWGETIAKALGVFWSHRGISHSLLGLFLFDKLAYWSISTIFNEALVNTNLVYWSLMIGYISHLVADGLTEEGVPLLYPLKMNFGFPPIKPWRIKTGGWFENLMVTPTVVLFTLWILIVYWPSFANIFR